MDTSDIIKLAGQGGGFLVILAAFVWLIRSVGVSMVQAIKELKIEVREHTVVDLAHHADVRADIAELRGEMMGIASERHRSGLTPVEGTPVSVGTDPIPILRGPGYRKPRPGGRDG